MHKFFVKNNREAEIQHMMDSRQRLAWLETELFIVYRPPHTHYHDSEKCSNFTRNRVSILAYYIRCCTKTNIQLYKMSLTPCVRTSAVFSSHMDPQEIQVLGKEPQKLFNP